MCLCRQTWIHSKLAQEVESFGGLFDEKTPEMDGDVLVATTKDGKEVVLEGVDGLLYFVVAVNIWWHEF